MSWLPPDDFEAPPPAYEEDFDRKVALAVETSLSIQESAPAQDDGEWEQWDEAKFQANAAAIERGSGAAGSSSGPQHDRRPEPPAKQKPSWYDEAGLGQSQAGSSVPSGPTQPVLSGRAPLPEPPPPPFSSQQQQQQQQQPPVSQVHVLPPDDEDHDEPLPPFTSVAGVPQDQVNVMGWSASRSPSPLASPPMPTSALRPPPPPFQSMADNHLEPMRAAHSVPSPRPSPQPAPPPARQSMPPPTRPAQQRLGPRPMTTNYTASGTSQPREGTRVALPHVQFDPAVAYSNNRNNAVPIAARRPAAPVAASSFYNTSVSASMSAKQGAGAPQPSRHLPERNFTPDPRSLYDTGAYHSPKPFRPYSNVNLPSPTSIPPPPPMPQYPQNGWQQPQGGYGYYQ